MIRDAILLYTVYSAAMLIVGIVVFVAWRAFQSPIETDKDC